MVRVFMAKKIHPMVDALVNLRGNTRACVLTEPLWGIPYNLYMPYISVYMLALGLNDAQIGLLASIGLFLQIFMSLISGVVTDKLGRRMTTLVFDVLSWSVPTLIWAFAQNFYFFLAASLFNAVYRITYNSWNLLLVEDAPPDKLVPVWSWITIAGLLSGFFAPLAGFLVSAFSMVTAVRILYINAFVFMTLKFIVLYVYSTETGQGKTRMAETAGVPFRKMFKGYGASFRTILRNPYTLNAFFVYLAFLIYDTIKTIFWSIMVVKQLGFPDSSIAVFPFFRSALMLGFYFFVTPKLNHLNFKKPFLLGFSLLIVSNVFLVLSPARSYLFVTVSVLLDAAAYAMIGPFKETLIYDAVEPEDRAGIMAIMNVAMLVIATPFGWIAGILSERSRLLPFGLITVFAVIGILFVFRITRYKKSFGAS
jgi:MFS family permease